MVFSFQFWWFCNSKHTEGVPMAQLFATGIYINCTHYSGQKDLHTNLNFTYIK